MLSLEIIYYLIDYSIRLLGGMCSYGEGALIGFLIGTELIWICHVNVGNRPNAYDLENRCMV